MVKNIFPHLPTGDPVSTPIPSHCANYGIRLPAMGSSKSGERAVAAQNEDRSEPFDSVCSVIHDILPGVLNDDNQTLTDWRKLVKEIFSRPENTLPKDQEELGLRIQLARKRAGFTQGELAKALGIPQGSLCRYEQGHRMPPALLVGKIAEHTGCDAGWLLTGKEKEGQAALEVRKPNSPTIERIPLEALKLYLEERWVTADDTERGEILGAFRVTFPDFVGWLKTLTARIRNTS